MSSAKSQAAPTSGADLDSGPQHEEEAYSPWSSADVSQNLRRKYYVSRVLQGGLIARMAAYWQVYHLVLWHAMFVYRWMRHGGEMLAGGRPRTFLELYSEFASQNYALVVCALAILPLLLWDGIRTTHRIAGPVVRFRKALASLTRGERIPPIKLRDDDLLHDLEASFNEYLATLRGPSENDDPATEDARGDEVLEELLGSATVDESAGDWPTETREMPVAATSDSSGV